jgi:hypothetical protein
MLVPSNPLCCCKRFSYKCEFNDPVFDFPTVYKALCNVSNSAAGPDNLPGCLFRKLALELTPSFIIIFQKSYLLGCLPDMWRLACVRPIFKKGVKDLASNRPVSLTCVACKLMEGRRSEHRASSFEPTFRASSQIFRVSSQNFRASSQLFEHRAKFFEHRAKSRL